VESAELEELVEFTEVVGLAELIEIAEFSEFVATHPQRNMSINKIQNVFFILVSFHISFSFLL